MLSTTNDRLPESNGFAPPEAAVPGPCWLPQGEELEKHPKAVQWAVTTMILPLWNEVVMQAETAVERSAGDLLAYYAWLEVLQRAELDERLAPRDAQTPPPLDTDAILDRLFRISRFKLAAGAFSIRARERWRVNERRQYLEEVQQEVNERLDQLRQENEERRKLLEKQKQAKKEEQTREKPAAQPQAQKIYADESARLTTARLAARRELEKRDSVAQLPEWLDQAHSNGACVTPTSS